MTFTAENLVTGEETVPGTVLGDFEFDSWAESDWTVVNESGDFKGPFGEGLQNGAFRDQQTVVGYRGERLVNSFVGWDWPTGTLMSAPFTVEQPWLNLLVGGGNHPRVEGGQMGNEPPAGTLLWNGFEGLRDTGSLADLGWVGTGDLQAVDSPAYAGGDYYIGDARINVTMADSTVALPWSSDAYKLEVTVDPRDASFAGVVVRINDAYGSEGGEGTLIGIDTEADRLVVDRANAGEDSFHSQFAAAYSARHWFTPTGDRPSSSTSTGRRSRCSPTAGSARSRARSSRIPARWVCLWSAREVAPASSRWWPRRSPTASTPASRRSRPR